VLFFKARRLPISGTNKKRECGTCGKILFCEPEFAVAWRKKYSLNAARRK
jgi:hypothetical protein